MATEVCIPLAQWSANVLTEFPKIPRAKKGEKKKEREKNALPVFTNQLCSGHSFSAWCTIVLPSLPAHAEHHVKVQGLLRPLLSMCPEQVCLWSSRLSIHGSL